jgi:hypothetical protein
MAIYNTNIKKKNGSSWDTIYYTTQAKNVIAENGMTMQEIIDGIPDTENRTNAVSFKKDTVKVTSNTSTVTMKTEYNEATDMLLIFKNADYIEYETNYLMGSDNKSIITVGDEWTASEESPIYFNFILLKSVPAENAVVDGKLLIDGSVPIEKLAYEVRQLLKSTYSMNVSNKSIKMISNSSAIPLGDDFVFIPDYDEILAFKNREYIDYGVDYTIDIATNTLLVNGDTWVASDTNPVTLNIKVYKGGKTNSTATTIIQQYQNKITAMNATITTMQNQIDSLTAKVNSL